jgi:tetratricopeptide (TPR) repeat protein
VIVTEKTSVPRPNPTPTTTTSSTEEESKATDGSWQHGEWELGRRLVSEGTNGEEAAVREVLLDSVDGGPAENIILEGGPHFQDPHTVDEGGALHPIDQALILALCLDVSNSNPVDGLTNAEMAPYIERVLQQANNWMIHSTGLLERSWLEFERRKTMDRAMLQIQALIDQHSTKLTIMQSSYKAIEDSAPVQDRLRHIYQLVYPSQFELKRDLAIKYLRCQVFMSALNYFKELEMWDEVVTCYQLMQKPQRAEIVVREQLKINETPYMITSLADLTGKEDLYERAWMISQGRFPRAKRTLGKICYDRGDFEPACKHLTEALKVQPLVHTAWYLKGLCCMRLEWWEEGLQAFVRCIQQDEEVGEAWANMGAIHMRMKQYAKADHCLVEALKQKHNDWRILENLLSVNIALSKWKESIRYMSSLIDQRHQSQRPLHIRELRYLTMVAVTSCKQAKKTQDANSIEGTSEGISDSNDNNTPTTATVEEKYPSEALNSLNVVTDIAKALETLFDKITTTLKSEPDVWDIVAEYHFHLGQYKLCLEARIKQVSCVMHLLQLTY